MSVQSLKYVVFGRPASEEKFVTVGFCYVVSLILLAFSVGCFFDRFWPVFLVASLGFMSVPVAISRKWFDWE